MEVPWGTMRYHKAIYGNTSKSFILGKFLRQWNLQLPDLLNSENSQ